MHLRKDFTRTIQSYSCGVRQHKYTWCSSARPSCDLRSSEPCHLCVVTVSILHMYKSFQVNKQPDVFFLLFFILLHFDRAVTFSSVLGYFFSPTCNYEVWFEWPEEEGMFYCFVGFVVVVFFSCSKRKGGEHVLLHTFYSLLVTKVCGSTCQMSL